jgi:hypothetical protein
MAGHNYRLQYKDDVTTPNWIDVVPDVPASGTTTSSTNAIGNVSMRYFRVGLLP